MLAGGAVLGVVVSRIELWNVHLKRFAVVREGVLYRSAQPSERGLELLAERFGARTIACLRREDGPLRRDLLDLGAASGPAEEEAVARLGVRFLHWPMGGEEYWPWFGGEQFDDFFRLMDDPRNFPVAVHCIGGRHRTGTFVALYRLEYERWNVEEALREMHDFEFGHPTPIQDHNLRTYLPRPLPDDRQWLALRETFGAFLNQPEDYPEFIRRLRERREPAERLLVKYVSAGQPFCLPLAHRVIDRPGDSLAALACGQAMSCLRESSASAIDWAIAAAIIADFGQPTQQEELLALLKNEPRRGPPSPRYQAIVCGVTNRYSANRIPLLRPLLDDERPRVEGEAMYGLGPEALPYRYCDTAVARLCAITNLHGVESPDQWEMRRQQFLAWLDAQPEFCRVARLGEHPFVPSREAGALEDRDDYR